MACGGPSKDFAFEQGEEAFKSVMIILEETYHACRPEVMEGTMFGREVSIGRRHQKVWDEQAEQLKLIIQEMVWTSDAASW